MKTSMKILAASVALTMSGAANAAIQFSNGTGNGPGELFMTAWDQAGAQSYSRDLGIYQTDLLANPSQTLSYDLTKLDTGVPDANWAKFISTGSKGVGVVYTVTSANKIAGTSFGLLTTSPSTVADIATSTNTYSKLSVSTDSINFEAQALNGNAYNVNGADFQQAINIASVNLSTYSTVNDGGYFGLPTWSIDDGGKTFNTIGKIGSNVAFYSVLAAPPKGAGTITKLPNVWTLDTTGKLTLSAVPVPAAVWLFGSGLLGLVSVARRRKV